MYLYIIFSLLSFFVLFEVGVNKRIKIAFVFFFILLFCLSFLRWERGADWISYITFFDNVNEWGEDSQFEILYVLLNKIVYNSFGNYTVMLLSEAAIIYSLYFLTIKKYSISPIFSLLIWFSFSFAGIFFTRQTISLAILFFSIKYIKERKLLLFLVVVLFSIGFHRSSLIFIPAYYIYNLHLSNKKILIIILFSLVCSSVFLFLFQILSQMGLSVFSDKALSYITLGLDESFGSQYSPMEIMIRGLIYRVVNIFVIFYLLRKKYEEDSFFRGIANIYVFGVLIFAMTVPISVALIRFSLSYEMLQILIYPYFIFHFRNKNSRILITVLLLFYLLFRFYGVIFTYEELYIPYKSIFNKELPVILY